MTTERGKVESRNDVFAERTTTKIWQEIENQNNPYLADSCLCHGYDLLELTQKRSFVEVLYLLFRGDLPDSDQARLLEQLMIALINPGPRHSATRAAMNAAVGGTDREHILPIALSIFGGSHLGAAEVEPAMDWLRKQRKHDPQQLAHELIANGTPPEEGDWHIAPGFGSRFGGVDPMPAKVASHLSGLPGKHETLSWGCKFADALNGHSLGWLTPAIAAAVFTDLGLSPRAGAGLFQLLGAPGLLAHGVELSNKPVTAMPFVKDENYVFQYE
jgi:citrate synthase